MLVGDGHVCLICVWCGVNACCVCGVTCVCAVVWFCMCCEMCECIVHVPVCAFTTPPCVPSKTPACLKHAGVFKSTHEGVVDAHRDVDKDDTTQTPLFTTQHPAHHHSTHTHTHTCHVTTQKDAMELSVHEELNYTEGESL